MGIKLDVIRKSKALFIRYKLHVLVEPFSNLLLNLAYLSKMSKWIHQNRPLKSNDFYSKKWIYTKRYDLYKYLLGEEKLDLAVNYLEFGVAEGLSFKWWIDNNKDPESRFYGFDTFEGLPEDWGGFKAGDMSAGSKFPEINDERATFIKGLFQDTLPLFLKTFTDDMRKVILMDADMYTSTLYVLTSLAPLLNKGDIILFDEFTVPLHEFLAFYDFTRSYYIEMEPVAATNNYYFSAFRVK
jgi:O-methyltransferase